MRAVLDTSVLISGGVRLDSGFSLAVASLSYAELQFGAAKPGLPPLESARRRARLQQLMATFGQGLPFDDQAATSYGILSALVVTSGQQVRRRQLDLLLAAVAHAHQAALVTENGSDFITLRGALPVMKPTGDLW